MMTEVAKKMIEYGLILAREYNCHVSLMAFPKHIRGAISRINEIPIILVNEDDRPERINFTIAYELSHIILEHKPHMKSPEQENEAFIQAADLLIDDAEIRSRAYEPLEELKKYFYWCSHEVIARKCLQHREAVLTIFDNYHLTSRILSPLLGENRTISLQNFEQSVVNRCRKLKRRIRSRNKEMECWANYIEDPPGNPYKRIIIFTEGRDTQTFNPDNPDVRNVTDEGSQIPPYYDEMYDSQEIEWDESDSSQ